VIVSPEFWSAQHGGKRGYYGPSKEWLVEHVREGWDVGLLLGGAGDWSYEITRIDLAPEGMRVVVTERFAGTLADYADLHDQRFRGQVVDDPSEISAALWRFGVEYEDGLRITTVDARIVRGGTTWNHPDIVISELGSSGHFTEYPHPYWFSPAPPPGALRFALEWPMAGVPFLSTTVDLGELARRPTTPVEWPPERLRLFRVNDSGEDAD
jgi:hypothetical protein